MDSASQKVRRPWDNTEKEKRFALLPNQKSEISDSQWRKLIEDWIEAIEALVEPVRGDGNPKPLAQILRSGRPMPMEALGLLAELIDPTEAVFNGKLVTRKSKARVKRESRAHRAFTIAMQVRKVLPTTHSVEDAVAYVAKKNKVSTRWVDELRSPFVKRNKKLWGQERAKIGKKAPRV